MQELFFSFFSKFPVNLSVRRLPANMNKTESVNASISAQCANGLCKQDEGHLGVFERTCTRKWIGNNNKRPRFRPHFSEVLFMKKASTISESTIHSIDSTQDLRCTFHSVTPVGVYCHRKKEAMADKKMTVKLCNFAQHAAH